LQLFTGFCTLISFLFGLSFFFLPSLPPSEPFLQEHMSPGCSLQRTLGHLRFLLCLINRSLSLIVGNLLSIGLLICIPFSLHILGSTYRTRTLKLWFLIVSSKLVKLTFLLTTFTLKSKCIREPRYNISVDSLLGSKVDVSTKN
jgi:hypothetical protein